MKPFFTLTFIFAIQLYSLAQGTNFYSPLQSDSIYKSNSVKSRTLQYNGNGPGRNKEVLFFNNEGKLIQSDTYFVEEESVPRYRAVFIYNHEGNLDSLVSRDLQNHGGLLGSMVGKKTNQRITKFQFNSSNKLIRKFSSDSYGDIYAESFFYEKAIVTHHYDMRKKLRLEFIDSVEKDNWYNKSITISFSDSGTVSSKFETQYIYKYDEKGRVIKAYQTTEQKHLIFEYIYNKKGLLKRIIMSGLYDAEIKFKYDFWDEPENNNFIY